MPESQWQEQLTPIVRTLQIIVGALVAGCLTFAGVVIAQSGAFPAKDEPLMITYVGFIFAAMALVAHIVVPGIIVAQGRRKIARGTWSLPQQAATQAKLKAFIEQAGDAGKLWMLFNVKTIVAAATLEGATFFMLVAVMLEGSPLALAAAMALVLGVALQFPTRTRVIHWIDAQLQRLEQEKQFNT